MHEHNTMYIIWNQPLNGSNFLWKECQEWSSLARTLTPPSRFYVSHFLACDFSGPGCFRELLNSTFLNSDKPLGVINTG